MTNSGRSDSGQWDTRRGDAGRDPNGRDTADVERGDAEPGTAPPPDTAELRKDIAHTREELGATVEALAAKADVVGRAKGRAEKTKANVRDQAQHGLSSVRRKVGDVGQEGRHQADRLAAKAKETAGSPEARTGGKGVMVVATLAAAVAVTLWVRRRRARMNAAARILGTRPGGARPRFADLRRRGGYSRRYMMWRPT